MFLLEENRRHAALFPEKEYLRQWTELAAWDLVPYIYLYCTVHYMRNLHNLGKAIPKEVFFALASLASAQPVVDLEEVLTIIRAGGPKAIGKSC